MNNDKFPETFFAELDWSLLMESIGEHLATRLNSYSNSHGKKTEFSSIAIEKLTPLQEDQILDSYPQLINPNYRAWMIKRLRQIGKQAFIERADRAVKYGCNPQKLFVSLLK